MAPTKLPGPLVLGGGGELGAPAKAIAADLVRSTKAKEAIVLPTAAAFEHPDRAADLAGSLFADAGAAPRALPVLRRADAEDPLHVDAVRAAKLVVIADGSPLHLRSVFKGSALIEALVEAWRGGAAVWASGAGATVLCDPMVDPRGGAYTVGLGLVTSLAAFPHHHTAPAHLWERSVELRPAGSFLAGIDDTAVLLRGADRAWSVGGTGAVTLLGDGGGPEVYEASVRIRTLMM